MITNAKSPTTASATKTQKTLPMPSNSILQTDWDLLGTSPNPAESVLNVKTNYDPNVWQSHGLCSFCHLAIEVRRRGRDVRHVDSHIPFGECTPATRAPIDSVKLWGGPLLPDSVFTEAVAFNERHRDILDKADVDCPQSKEFQRSKKKAAIR